MTTFSGTLNYKLRTDTSSMIYHHPNGKIIIVDLNFYHTNFRVFQDHMSYDYNILVGYLVTLKN